MYLFRGLRQLEGILSVLVQFYHHLDIQQY